MYIKNGEEEYENAYRTGSGETGGCVEKARGVLVLGKIQKQPMLEQEIPGMNGRGFGALFLRMGKGTSVYEGGGPFDCRRCRNYFLACRNRWGLPKREWRDSHRDPEPPPHGMKSEIEYGWQSGTSGLRDHQRSLTISKLVRTGS